MIIILIMVAAFYYIVHVEMRAEVRHFYPRYRVALIAVTVSTMIFGYAYYQANRPPIVDYYGTGWLFSIRDLNANLQSRGNPNRIPVPGE